MRLPSWATWTKDGIVVREKWLSGQAPVAELLVPDNSEITTVQRDRYGLIWAKFHTIAVAGVPVAQVETNHWSERGAAALVRITPIAPMLTLKEG
jgi:hypothetical protein